MIDLFQLHYRVCRGSAGQTVVIALCESFAMAEDVVSGIMRRGEQGGIVYIQFPQSPKREAIDETS